jgi:hypothetical protein
MNVVLVRSSSKRKTLVTMINSVAMVTNVTIVNIGKLAILATKANMQQENSRLVCNVGNHGSDNQQNSHKHT